MRELKINGTHAWLIIIVHFLPLDDFPESFGHTLCVSGQPTGYSCITTKDIGNTAHQSTYRYTLIPHPARTQ